MTIIINFHSLWTVCHCWSGGVSNGQNHQLFIGKLGEQVCNYAIVPHWHCGDVRVVLNAEPIGLISTHFILYDTDTLQVHVVSGVQGTVEAFLVSDDGALKCYVRRYWL